MDGMLIFAAAVIGLVYVCLNPEWIAPYFAGLVYMRVSDVLRGEFGLPSLFMFVAPLLLGVLMLRWLTSGERVGRGWQPALWMLLVYAVVCVGSLIFAAETDRTRAALMNYLDGVFIVLVLAASLRHVEDLDRTLWSLVLVGLVLGSLTVYQQSTNDYGRTFAGFAQVELRNIYDKSSGFRSAGPVSANYFGLLLVPLVPLAVHRLVFEARPSLRLLALASLVSMLLAIGYTYSRGAIVALAAVSALTLLWLPRKWLGRAVLGVGVPMALALVVIAPTDYGQRLLALRQVVGIAKGEAPQDGALRGRLSELQSALMMFRDHPVIGVGYGNFELHYPRYAHRLGLDGRREEREAHSLYLEVAAETGLLGIITFGGMVGGSLLILNRAQASLRAADLVSAARLVGAFSLGLLGYLAGSVFLHLSYPRFFWVLLGIAYGTTQFLSQPSASRAEDDEPSVLAAMGA